MRSPARSISLINLTIGAGGWWLERRFRHALRSRAWNPILTIRGLTKIVRRAPILRGVDLDVFPGDVVSIIGASGSGKTTLLRCIDLLEEFEGGEIRLDGELLGYRVERRPAASPCRAASSPASAPASAWCSRATTSSRI